MTGMSTATGFPAGDGSWDLRILVTDLQVERTIRVKGEMHVGGLMIKLVDELGKNNKQALITDINCALLGAAAGNYAPKCLRSRAGAFVLGSFIAAAAENANSAQNALSRRGSVCGTGHGRMPLKVAIIPTFSGGLLIAQADSLVFLPWSVDMRSLRGRSFQRGLTGKSCAKISWVQSKF
jgi:hypothetical protein